MPEKLPKGWVKTTLGEIAEPSRERALPADVPKMRYVGLEHIEPHTMRLRGHGLASDVRSSSVRFSQGDVLYGKMRPYLNKVWVAEFDGICSTEFLVFSKCDGLNSPFLAMRLNAEDFVAFANGRVSGERPRVDFEALSRFQIFLPPVSEQNRIVAKLNAALTPSQRAEVAARRAQERLKHYRTATQQAAITGELTRDWRKTHKPDETGAQLLQRLLKARRARWEETELQRHREARKPPKNKKWKSCYPEPVRPKTNDLPELPISWTWASLEMIAEIGSGISVSQNRIVENPVEVPYLRVANVLRGALDLSEIKKIRVNRDHLKSFLLETGDILFNEGGDRDKLGRGWIWEGQIPRCVHQNHVFRARLIDRSLVDARLVSHWGNTFGQQFFIRHGKQTTNLASINRSVLAKLPVPISSTEEQNIIICELERRLTSAERLAATLKRQLERSQATRHSLQRQAFAGNLVAQDPKDEPASVLLDRIRAAREAEAKKPKTMRTSPTPAKKRSPVKVSQQKSGQGGEPPKGEPLFSVATPTTPRQVKLLRLKLYQDFNSLKASEFVLRSVSKASDKFSPICLVGLNGSGKSNLIEALSEIFCHVELSLLPWKEITSKQRMIDLCFDLEYQLFEHGSSKPTCVRLEKATHKPVVFTILHDEKEKVVTDATECLALLPTRVIGYSSGLNETISIPFFRTAAIYSQEVLKQAQREKKQPKEKLPDVPDSRTFFMDYECNSLILVANYLLQPTSRLRLFRRNLRIGSLNSFDIRYRPTYQGTKRVELTRELKSYIDALRESADSVERLPDNVTDVFHFVDPKAAALRIKQAFLTPNKFFRALYKLSLLNPLALTGRKRKFFLREDARAGQLERPPTVSREDRIFSLENIRLNLTKPRRAIDYAAISDGEHQFLQVFGSASLFDEPGCVFLLDEPETHFNPQWRRLCVQWLAKIRSTASQELMISTHSPFVVSGCHKDHVFKFTREGDFSVCSKLGVETFGASYDFLLARLFDLETMISGQAIEEMREVLKSTSIEKLRNAIPQFGESFEKRFLFERIAKLKQKQRRKR